MTVRALVVAVSGFYFGTASTARGAKLAQEAVETAHAAKPKISTRSAPDRGKVGETYDLQVQATGGRQPYKWSLGGGQDLPGLKLGVDSAVLSGTPTRAATYDFPSPTPPARATSTRSNGASRTSSPPPIDPTSNPS